MILHEGEKYRCEDCNAQVAVIRSSDTRSLDFEAPIVSTNPAACSQIWADSQPHLFCCGKAMVRFCIKAAVS